MKKYGIYLGTLAIGLLMGWIFFGNESAIEQHKHDEQKLSEHWTCSMHPQIDLPEFGTCPICGMDLIQRTESEEGLSLNQFKMSKNAMALANIETIVVGNTLGIEKLITLSGKISENNKASAIQTAHFGGRIEKLYFKTSGEFVTEGSLIASIYSPELVTAQNELIEAIELKESQPELYKAVRNKLKYWKISDEQIKSIEYNKKVQTNFNMYANVSGFITEFYIEEGNHVKEGTPLFNIADLSSVWANFDVYETDIKRIKLGQAITIGLNAYPNKLIKTIIDYIDPVINSKTRTVSVRATLQNKDNALKPGMLITSSVAIDSKKEKNTVITIPKTALLWTGKRSVVYVQTAMNEPIFEMREVLLGNEMDDAYEILSGLEKGDVVVVNGAFTVDASAQLQGKKSMMNQGRVKNNTGNNVSTGSATNSDEDMSEIVMIDKSTIDSNFKKQLGNVISEYINLKDALINDDTATAQIEAKKVKESIKKVDMLLLLGDAHLVWMKTLDPIKIHIDVIIKSKDIGSQRAAFLVLSNKLSEAIKTFGIETKRGKPLYLEFCPMADDNKGGFWLSYDKTIKNPYFGKAMLTCGKVIETYK